MVGMLRVLVSVVEVVLALEEVVLGVRFNGVNGVRVVCDDVEPPRPPEMERPPATTEAAVAPGFGCESSPSEATAAAAEGTPGGPFRATDVAKVVFGVTPTEAERDIGFAARAACCCAAAAAGVGKPEPVLTARAMDAGIGAGAGFAGSSNSGTGKTG